MECINCNGKGYIEFYPIDGMTIYKWMKPEKTECPECNGGDD